MRDGFSLFGDLAKVEEQSDGTLKVFGVASSGARDDEGEIVLPAAMKAALPDYAKYPALREMHQPSAAGRTLEAEVDADGFTRIVAHVVDPIAIAKVKSKTYAGFSIGGKVLARDPLDRTIITSIKLGEISLVDRPCNPEAEITLFKADIGDETPMPYAPTNDEVKARAADLAKAAGKTAMDAFKGYVVQAREALIAEHAAAEASSPVEAYLNDISIPPEARALKAAVMDELRKSAPDLEGEALVASARAAMLGREEGDEPADIVVKHIAREEAARQAEVIDPAATLAAAIAKAKEAEAAPPPGAAPTLDLAKTAAALRLLVSASEGKLTKGLYSVSRLAEIIDALAWLQRDTTWEASAEGDSSGVPADLAANVATLLGILARLVSEEAAEIVQAYQEHGLDVDLDGAGDVVVIEAASSILDLAKADTALMEKVGARNSKADQANIQDAHDALTKLGAMCDPNNTPADEADKAAKAEGLEKLAAEASELITKQAADLAELKRSAAGEAERTAAAIEKALADFRKEAMPAKTAASTQVAIGKEQDSGGAEVTAPSAEDVQKALAALSPEDRAFLLMKVALSNGRKIG